MHFGDYQHEAAGLEDWQNFFQVPGSIRPVIVRFDRCNKVEDAVWKGQAGHAGQLDGDLARCDACLIECASSGDKSL